MHIRTTAALAALVAVTLPAATAFAQEGDTAEANIKLIQDYYGAYAAGDSEACG